MSILTNIRVQIIIMLYLHRKIDFLSVGNFRLALKTALRKIIIDALKAVVHQFGSFLIGCVFFNYSVLVSLLFCSGERFIKI